MLVRDDALRLLDLLVEAGDEAVTLDELEVVGVRDPGRALLELELAGHGVERVVDRTRRERPVTCVRLGPPPSPPAPGRHVLPVALVLLGVLLVARGLRR